MPQKSAYEPFKKAKCAECGKIFFRTSEHAYKRMTSSSTAKWYCSSSCYRVLGKIEEAEERQAYLADLIYYERKERLEKRMRADIRNDVAGFTPVRNKEETGRKLMDASAKLNAFTADYERSRPGTAEKKRAVKAMRYWKKRKNYLQSMMEFFEEVDAYVQENYAGYR